MRKLYISVLTAMLAAALWAADWPMPGGNPQRNGWDGSERLITKANVGSLQLLYKYQADNHSNGLASLTAPIINGNLITYLGFKEMLMFTGTSGKVFSVDADLNKLIWKTNLPDVTSAPDPAPTSSCPGGLTAPLVMAGSSSASLHFAALAAHTPAGQGVRFHRRSPYFPPLAESVYPLLPTTLTQLNALYTVSSDGYLHVLNSSTGQDLIPAMRFVPPNAKVTSLNLRDNVVYATTGSNCDGYRNALYAIDILSTQKTVTSFATPAGGFLGSAGTTIGNDGTVYVQTAYVPDKQTGHIYEAVIALNPKELTVKDYFILSNKPIKTPGGEGPGITPVVFSFPGRDMILAASTDGRLYLLDSRSLGGANHRTPLFASSTLVSKTKKYAGDGFRGAFSTWMDVDTGTRRFYAPVYGTPRGWGRLKANHPGGGDGFIVALELGGTSEKPTLKPLWISPEMLSPAPAVIANGIVFVLSTGQFPRVSKPDGKPYTIAEREELAKPARLYVLDADTGRDLYASKDVATGASLSTGLAFANGRAYFSGRDNAVYCFGIPAQHSQLFEQ